MDDEVFKMDSMTRRLFSAAPVLVDPRFVIRLEDAPREPTMTEAEWLASTDPAPMLRIGDGQLSQFRFSYRKLRLWVSACLRVSWRGLTAPGSRDSILLAERIADGEAPPIPTLIDDPNSPDHMGICGHDALAAAHYGAMNAANLFTDRSTQAALLREIIGNPFRPVTICPHHYRETPGGGKVHVFDCPDPEEGYHAPHCPLSWNDGAIPRFAERIYQERDWASLPIFADALQDAGCQDEDVLRHCRGWQRCHNCVAQGSPCDVCRCGTEDSVGWYPSSPDMGYHWPHALHARGCWVVDLFTGRS